MIFNLYDLGLPGHNLTLANVAKVLAVAANISATVASSTANTSDVAAPVINLPPQQAIVGTRTDAVVLSLTVKGGAVTTAATME